MSARADQIASWTLTLAAVVIAAGVARWAFFESVGAASTTTEVRLEYKSDWRDLLRYGRTVGSVAAPIQIIEFADLECPACRVFNNTMLAAARQTYRERLAVTFVHFPLSFHRFARPGAVAAECANVQGHFGEFVDLVYEKQDSLGFKSWSSFA